MFEFIATHALELVIAFLFSVLTGFVTKLYKKVELENDRKEKEYNALKAGMTAILRDRIVQAYYHYESRGSITLHGLENVNKMFEEYSNLGGNGSVKKLVHDLNELDVVDK